MKKETKKTRKFLSVFLALMIVVQILPLQVLAENITDAIAHQQFINDAINNPTSEDNNSDAEILYEVEEKRDEYTKVYKKSDGSYTAVKTIEPLHYLKDDVWEDINNSMSLNGNLYTNLDNLFNVEFPETIDSNENLTVEKDGYELSFSVDEIEESSATVENNIVVSDTNITFADEAISQTQSSITYNNVAEDTDLQYIVTPNSIKENIIVSNKESVKDTYAFTFETNGLNAEKLDDGSVIFKDENNEIKFRIPRPVMTDSNLTFSYDIDVVLLENTDDTITLEYSPSSEWINSSDRTYPITIDPAIMVENDDVSWVEDTWVSYDSSIKDSEKVNGYHDCAGGVINKTSTDSNNETIYQNSEIYTKFNIAALKSLGNNVVFTEVQYLFIGASVDGKAFAKEITSPVDLKTVTYETKPSLDSEVIDYYTSPYSSDEMLNGLKFSYIHFNLTKPLNDWYNGAENNGFAVVAGNEEYIGLFVLNGVTTSSSDTNTYTTSIVMDYVDMGGYNENYSYHTQSAGKAGTGYVNDFTQQLSVIRDDINEAGEGLPLCIGMTYNSATYDTLKSLNSDNAMLAYGNNWLPNYLSSYIIKNENYLTYFTDAGYMIEYICYTDNFGNITFEEMNCDTYGNHNYDIKYHPANNGNEAYYTINRPDGFAEKFNSNGLLVSFFNPEVTDKSINITYDSSSRVKCITDYYNNKIEYEYDTTLLSRIKIYIYDHEKEAYNSPITQSYGYENNCLTEVYLEGNQIYSYEYDENSNMTSMSHLKKSRVEYRYDSNGKVENVTEKYYDNSHYSIKNIITYNRSKAPQIKVTDNSGNYELYQFNSKGNLLYTIDSTEEDQSNIPGENNYIVNGDFTNELEGWTGANGFAIKESTINGKEINALELSGGTDTENTISQTVTIDGKKNDTIAVAAWFNGNFVKSKTNNSWLNNLIETSGDSNTCNFTNNRYAQIEISYEYETEDNSSSSSEEKIVIPLMEHMNNWQYISSDFELKGNCNELLVAIHYTNNANPALLSNIQLTKNGGYEISYYDSGDVTSPLKSMSLGYRDILSYSYIIEDDKYEGVNKIVYNDSAYQKNVIDIAYNNPNVKKPTDIFVNNSLKYHISYNENKKMNYISSNDNRIVRYAEDVNTLSSFSNNYLHSIKNNGGSYIDTTNNLEYLTKVYNAEYYSLYGPSAEKSDVVDENGMGIGIVSEQDWLGRCSSNTVEAKQWYNTDSNDVLATVKAIYGYDDELNYETINQVKTYTNNIYGATRTINLLDSNGFSYEYDENGNIIKEYDYFSENSLVLRYSYEYDENNLLVRYNDNVSEPKRSYSYEYDNDGNLLSKSTYSYAPLENELGELLTTEYYSCDNINETISCNEENATYNTSYNDAILTWNESNQLVSYTKTDDDNTTQIEYAYDENGTMIEKRVLVNGDLNEKYNYTWAYGKLINEVYTNYETSGEPIHVYEIRYVYDSFNSIQGFIFNKLDNSNIQSSTYLYLKNLQGDIVGMVDDSGNTILMYQFDEFGLPTTISRNLSDTNIGFIEELPMKYRGCYYDYDINLYYIDGKYYSPETGKFINTNNIDNAEIKDKSFNYYLGLYWNNHPTSYIDPVENEIYYANITANYLYNKELTNKIKSSDYYDENNKYIDNQGAFPVSKYRYGFSLSGPVGCGMVATYNALLLLEDPMEPHDIIRDFEMKGLFLYGFEGVNPFVIVEFFEKKGKDVKISLDKSEYDTMVKESTASILLYTKDSGSHYIAIKYNGDEQPLSYTAYNESTGKTISGSLSNFISNNQKSVLISITN